jgi:hypothetical protein
VTPPRLSIALISGAALAYEVLLMRLFAIIQWHHFAYMIISLALLGYGASGTFLSLTRRWLLPRFTTLYLANLILFALSSLVCFLIVQRLPFNPQEVLWDLHQPAWLLMIYLLLTLPFFFVANCIGLVLTRFPSEISRIYSADLLGAGMGSIAIIALLFMLFPQITLLVLATLIAVAGVVAWFELGLRPRWVLGVLSLLVVLPWCLPGEWTQPVISPYKGLSQLLQVSDTRIVRQSSSPLGLISVVESPRIPLRHAPGLSLQATQWPPEQLAIFTDGDAMTAITRHNGDVTQLAYLDQLTSALPYHLGTPQEVLVLGAGGGSGVLQARYHGVQHIDAVELNPQLAGLLRSDYADFSGRLFETGDSTLHVAEARGFVATGERRYDLIQIALLDSFSASSAGLYALSESYLYTVEALREYIDHLSAGGYLAISRWVKLPPRDTLKMFATAVQALEAMGIDQPGERLILIRSWQTSTLLIKNAPFTTAELEALREFCRQRSFDPGYYPGMGAAEANRYNILEQSHFYQGSLALLGEQRERFMADYKFNLQPATDNQPYFFHFFKWRVLPELMALRGQGGLPLLEMGYPILVATLLQAVLASFLLILLPLIILRRSGSRSIAVSVQRKGLLYFSMLGLAFLFIEIAFIQRFTLFLHHPLYAISVVLAAFLLFAGMGSAYSRRFVSNGSRATAIKRAVIAIIVLGLGYLLLLEALFNSLMGIPITAKVMVSIALIAPLGFSMGIPFPLGLARLNSVAPEMIPWVWGINGCASVVSAVLATLLAIHMGFSAVVLLALVFYAIAAVSLP